MRLSSMTRLPLRLLAASALTAFAWTAEASIAGDAASLQGTDWRLETINNHPIANGQPRLELGADGSVGGSTGCNVIKSTYALDDGSLSLGAIGTTRKFCRAVWETERAFLQMLDNVRGYAVDGNVLTLTGLNGETLATFRNE
jgi:heat shock protein HslJ